MKNLQIFPWNDNLATGLTDIDQQHRRLVELLNLLADHIVYQSDLPALNQVFDELANYAAYHFTTEEAVWKETLPGDDWEISHRASHASFITEVQRLRAEEGIKPIGAIVEDVLSFLTHWLAFHILDSDKRMAIAVQAIRQGMSIDDAKRHAEQTMNGALKVLVETVLGMYQHLSSRTLQLMREIIARQKMEARLRLAANVFDNTQESICIVDGGGLIVEANPAFCHITQCDHDEIVGRPLAEMKQGLADDRSLASILETATTIGHWRGELWSRARSGEPYVEWLTLSAVRDETGKLVNYVAVFSNVEQLIQREQAFRHMANHDALTGLPNRVLLNDRLELALANAERHGQFLAVCYMDLDGFKPVNDTFGHKVGDEVLKELARRLKGLLRSNDTVARLGGDEFVFLLGGLSGIEQCCSLLERILATVQEPIVVAGATARVSASIGVSLFPLHGTRGEELLQRADQAMYQAKGSGKARYRLYQPSEA